jgi:dipeptidyl aminopeptidase/acylaminoacyl peptidase
MNCSARVACATASLFLLVFSNGSQAAAPGASIPLESFARRPQMSGVTISPDGRYVTFLSGVGDETALMTFDRTAPGSAFKKITTSVPGKFDLGWCRFANQKRLLCGVYGNIIGKEYVQPPYTRLFSVEVDGSVYKSLDQSARQGNLFVASTSMRNFDINQGPQVDKSVNSQRGAWNNDAPSSTAMATHMSGYSPSRQDQVIDFTPGEDESVLMQMDDDGDGYNSIFVLNIYSGNRGVRMPDHPPIQSYVTDGRGNPRLGWGVEGVTTNYWARLDGDLEWRKLGATQIFTEANRLRPFAMAWATNTVYAFGNYRGRDALWAIDLTDRKEPELLFNHKLVDVGEPILRSDRSLLGVHYDVERPYTWYADETLRALIERLERLYPGRVHDIVDSTEDMKFLVVHAYNDSDAGTYYVYDRDKDKLSKLGSAYPELDPKALGTMSNIMYKAADGTDIPGYLTVPTGAEKKNLPLVVLPHDGPAERDTWQFSFLRNFLASRGYAVLQMNYRGSAGFGGNWQNAAHQDWGGLTYSDIQDATRWAISQGIADPKRICIMGWGFGGYSALLSAARDGNLYQCAVSIGGIADLQMQIDHGIVSGDKEIRRYEIGTDVAKLERDSPVKQAERINIPVLLIHGAKDWQVQPNQSQAMNVALKKYKKDVTLVMIKGATHELERQSERVTLLKEVEAFLAAHLGSGG